MSIVYHNTTIDSTGQVNYTKNGVTTNLTKVYYRKNGVDTLVWSKERNAASVSNSAVSSAGTATLPYKTTSRDLSMVIHAAGTGSSDYYYVSAGNMTSYGTGNELFGIGQTYYCNGSLSGSHTYAECSSFVSQHTTIRAATYTAYSYFNYTLTLRMNLRYPSNKSVKVYVNNNLVLEQDVSQQTEILTYTYKHSNTLTNQSATIPLKIEIYDSLGTLEETWTGTMASSATITYEG